MEYQKNSDGLKVDFYKNQLIFGQFEDSLFVSAGFLLTVISDQSRKENCFRENDKILFYDRHSHSYLASV